MRAAEKRRTVQALARRAQTGTEIPARVVDLILYHLLHLHMPGVAAEQSYSRLKRNFVDWNELRVSSDLEIRRTVSVAADAGSLVQRIKTLLNRIQSERSQLSLEFLGDLNKGDARRYLRSLGMLSPATIDLVLRQKKSDDVVPVDEHSERVLARTGLVPPRASRTDIQKLLRRLVPEDRVLRFHRAVLDIAQRLCVRDEEAVKCSECPLREMCAFGRSRCRAAQRNGRRRNGSRRA